MQINPCTRRLDRLTLTREDTRGLPGGLGAGDNTDEAPRVLKTNGHFCEDTGRLGARERRTIKNWLGKFYIMDQSTNLREVMKDDLVCLDD